MSEIPGAGETALKSALALVPVVGGPLAVVVDDLMQRRRHRVQRAATVALEAYPAGPGALAARLRDDERLAELFWTALESAEGLGHLGDRGGSLSQAASTLASWTSS